MCPTSNLRCGSCLSKWNGKSWEESYKCVLPVKSWSLVLNNKFQLCIEGLCDINSDLAVCIPITDRLNSYWVSNDCTLVKLRGILNTKELPEYVAAKFAHGIPTNWKEIVNKWIQYVQRDEKSSFSWEQDESFGSFDTSVLLTRSRRIISERKSEGNLKGKSTQRTPGESSRRCVEDERDSAVPASEDCSATKNQPGLSPSAWHSTAAPQLPAYKLEQIFQWIDSAHLSSKPVEREVEDGHRDISGEFVAPSDPVSNRKNRSLNSELVQPKTNNVVQSTPVSGVRLNDSEGLPSWNVSSVHSTLNNSAALGSVASDLFNKSDSWNQPKKNSKDVSSVPPSRLLPAQENMKVPGSETNSDQPSSNLVSASVFREPSRGQPRKTASKMPPGKLPRNSKNAEVPGSRMGRMLSSSLRPRRKQTLQKIERWRPVLGVDGCLKVQGYLLLQCDMTAGQILTTNTVVSWGERRVVTCDGREYELIGDPYGKIPDDLKNKLLKPLDCADITDKLIEFQGLKEDVTSCFYLAPPPAPMMMSMTRSGRVCRPRAPYWLNRSDWGAEYELFYGNVDSENRDGDQTTNRSSRSAQNMRTNRRTTPRNTSVTKQKSKSSSVTINTQEASRRITETPTSNRSRGAIRKNSNSASTSTGLISESSPRSQRSTNNTPGLNLSVNNRNSNKDDKNSSNLRSTKIILEKTSGSETVNNNQAVLSNNQQDKENNFIGKNNSDGTRSCFENITWKSTQNQMMMPSPRLCADASNVDFSSSRIKVSYLTSGTKSPTNNVQNSSEFHSRSPALNETFSSSECTPKSRPSRSPSKRACLPCLQDSKSRTASHSPHTPVTHVRHQTVPEKRRTQTISPSPVRNQSETSPQVVPVTRSRGKPSLQVSKTPVGKQSPQHSLPSNKRRASVVASSARRKTPGKILKISPSPKCLRSTSRTTARQLRVMVQRLDARKSPQKAATFSPNRMSSSSRPQRKSVTKEKKEATPKLSKRNEREINMSASKKIQEKEPVEVTKKTKKDKKGNGNYNVKKNQKKEKKVKKDQVKKIEKNEEKTTKKVEEKRNKNKKMAPTKISPTTSEGITEEECTSDCSSDSSVGPSASVIFQLNNPPPTRRKPRTLKERRERDAQLAEMGRKLAAKETVGIDADDDPMANLIASHKFSPLPQEWCRHENLLGKNRKRRRPSSSDGTVSPSRSGLDDGFGNEDATSSVATPQLLMRPPDPKQVQSYLQRQRAWNAKPQRPTRQSKRSNDNLLLPHIDYAAVFRPDISDSEECTSEVSVTNSDWDA